MADRLAALADGEALGLLPERDEALDNDTHARVSYDRS